MAQQHRHGPLVRQLSEHHFNDGKRLKCTHIVHFHTRSTVLPCEHIFLMAGLPFKVQSKRTSCIRFDRNPHNEEPPDLHREFIKNNNCRLRRMELPAVLCLPRVLLKVPTQFIIHEQLASQGRCLPVIFPWHNSHVFFLTLRFNPRCHSPPQSRHVCHQVLWGLCARDGAAAGR